MDGAIATSVSHDAHNIIVAGDSDADMAQAVNVVRDMGGGECCEKGTCCCNARAPECRSHE